jgi:hypothetical protein
LALARAKVVKIVGLFRRGYLHYFDMMLTIGHQACDVVCVNGGKKKKTAINV